MNNDLKTSKKIIKDESKEENNKKNIEENKEIKKEKKIDETKKEEDDEKKKEYVNWFNKHCTKSESNCENKNKKILEKPKILEKKDSQKIKEDKKEKNEKKKDEKLEKSKSNINSIKKKPKKPEQIAITLKDYNKYTCFQKIKIYYVNYFNYKICFSMIININWDFSLFNTKLSYMYHFYLTNGFSEEKPNLVFFLKNKKIKITDKKIFKPNEYDFKNDYIVILEKENLYKTEIDFGTRNSYLNLKGSKIPHFVVSSGSNLEIECLLISKGIVALECELYEVKKEFFIPLEYDNVKNLKRKAKEFLESNWKDKSIFISNIKSTNSKKSENYDANYFVLRDKVILKCGKIYVFLVTTSMKKLYAFNPRYDSKDGVFIITKDKKGILNGFLGRKRSDFVIASEG